MSLVVAIVVPAVLPFENIFSHYLWPWGLAVLVPGDMVVGVRAYVNESGWAFTYVVALLFWACVGFFYARWTLRIRTFHFVLLAYPVMLAVLWVFVAPIDLLFEESFGISLGTM